MSLVTCELCALNSDIAFPARSLAKQVVDNVLCVRGRDAAAGEEGKQAVCRVAVTGDIIDENSLIGNTEEVLLGLDDKHGIDGAQVFFGVGKRGVGGGDQLILHRETGAVGADEQRIALPRALGDVGAPFGPLLRYSFFYGNGHVHFCLPFGCFGCRGAAHYRLDVPVSAKRFPPSLFTAVPCISVPGSGVSGAAVAEKTVVSELILSEWLII